MVLTARARRRAFSIAKAFSIGFEVGAIGRKESEPSILGANNLLSGCAFMGRQIVQDDDVARFEGRSQLESRRKFR